MNTRKVGMLVVAVLVLLLFAAPVVQAVNPHLIYVRLAGNVVSFKIAGLGDNQMFFITAGADATAEYWCQNNGGNYPEDPKKQVVQGPVSASGWFASGKNGQITASLALPVPEPDPFCPPGQSEVLQWVTYENPWVTW